jgi:outer membrane lipoprotein-sorting protein
MKIQRISMLLTLLMVLLLPGSIIYAQFTAEMHFTTSGKERVFQIYSDGNNYRYEFNEDGQEGIVIVPKSADYIFVLIPQQKMAIKSSASSQMSMSSDPVKQYEYWQNDGATEKVIGNETVNGIDCIKKELHNIKKDEYGEVDQHMFTIWYSDEYKFPIKMENYIDGTGTSGMELKDIKPWTPNSDSFKIPEGYNVMEQ